MYMYIYTSSWWVTESRSFFVSLHAGNVRLRSPSECKPWHVRVCAYASALRTWNAVIMKGLQKQKAGVDRTDHEQDNLFAVLTDALREAVVSRIFQTGTTSDPVL